MAKNDWERLGEKVEPSWYLDPLVARQKRDVYAEIVRRSLPEAGAERLLKTDLFEDAFGEDEILSATRPWQWVGFDVSVATGVAARKRWPAEVLWGLSADVRALPFREGHFPAVVSLSTLDHFPERGDYVSALRELARVLRPGGTMVLSLDNPDNIAYGAVKSYLNWRGPFPIGYTPKMEEARRDLEACGLKVEAGTDWIIHNPRLVSTLLFLALRKLLGRRADGLVKLFLRLFAMSPKLLGGRRTACWYVLRAVKKSESC